MAESIKNRVSRLISAGAHALVGKLEQAQAQPVLEQFVRDVDKVADEIRAELGKTASNRHLTQQQYAALNNEYDRITQSLSATAEDGNEEILHAAISRQLDIEAQLPVLENALGELTQQEKELSSYVDALMGKQREMREAITQMERAKQQSQAPVVDGVRNKSAKVEQKVERLTRAFDDVYQKNTGETVLEKQANMAQAGKIKTLHELAREKEIANRIQALKQKK